MATFNELIAEKSGKSHKRAIAVVFAAVIIIVLFILLFVEIPEKNESIINQIVYIFAAVIVYQSGASVYEKTHKTHKKENQAENNEENVC